LSRDREGRKAESLGGNHDRALEMNERWRREDMKGNQDLDFNSF
jgi:hypothetical protein